MRRLLAVMAHPDDESMGTGGLILRHTRAEVEVHLICATHGEQGWAGKPDGARPPDLGEIRAKELEDAAAALALSGVELWDYPDSGLDKVDETELTQRIWDEIARLRPAVVVGWGPDSGQGHPDHIAIGGCTDAAVAATPSGGRPAVYHLAVDEQLAEFYRMMSRLTGLNGAEVPEVVVDHVDAVMDLSSEEVMMKLRAIECHKSQLEDWRVELRKHPDLLQRGYGHEPYVAPRLRAPQLTKDGLLGEFA